MHELEERLGRPNLSTNQASIDALFDSDEYDTTKRAIAAAADRHANMIFSASFDQRSYLESPVEPIELLYPDDEFRHSVAKFARLDRPVILHAPSSPQIKGTHFVRDAIHRLEAEGYSFEYVELVGVDHAQVQRQLARAHIVLNQFYAFLPGVFGLEALASTSVMLCSADEHIEPAIPAGGNEAWILTIADEVYANLKRVLDEPDSMLAQAEAGYRWAQRSWSASVAGERVRGKLESVLGSIGDAGR
ncbi:hypothetical protein ACWGST_03780 [Agromyces sp. NPDC055520]